MVYGTNMATCSQCGNGYLTGDCIDLNGKCDKCEYTTVVDLTHLVSPIMREKLKQEIQGILNDALSGAVDIYRYKQDDESYIRWGLVGKHINETIDLYWSKDSDNEG